MVGVDELRARVARRIRETAARRGMPLTRLVDVAKVSRSQFWRVLGGSSSPSLDFLAKVALALEVDPDELVRRPRAQRKQSGNSG